MLNKEIRDKFLSFIFSAQGLFVLFALYTSYFLRIDAEYLIFLSICCVMFSIWNSLTEMVGKYYYVKSATFHYYFIRYYQGRLWLIYNTYLFVFSYLYVKRLPYFLNWYRVYSTKLNNVLFKEFKAVSEKWDDYLNYAFYSLIVNLMSMLWLSFYKFYFNLYAISTESEAYKQNLRRLNDYIQLNRSVFVENNASEEALFVKSVEDLKLGFN